MYGYIRFYSDELKIKDYHLFQSYYCGLCRQLQCQFGARGRLLLSYDLTFAAIFMDSLSEAAPPQVQGRCPLRPLRKRPLIDNSAGLRRAADLSVLMGYSKMEDHWRDEKSLLGRLAMALYRSRQQSVHQRSPALAAVTADKLAAFYAGEESGRLLDELTDPFASLVGEALSLGAPAEQQMLLAKIGYHCGRWIYLIDALDDLPSDWQKGRFNPYRASFPVESDHWHDFYKTAAHDIEANLYFSLEEICLALAKLPFKRHQALIENIFYLGIRHVTDTIVAARHDGKEEKFADPFRLRTIFRHRRSDVTPPPASESQVAADSPSP